jgi:dienelactone hydrolase
MGTLILSIAFVTEIGFTVYRVITRSNQEKVRSYIRLGAFAAFVLFALVAVIRWGFIWYGLALLLLVWAALGAWTLIRKKVDTKEYKTGSVVVRAILGFLLVGVVILPALIFPQHRAPRVTGTHPVATALYTYTDPNRIETFTNTGENSKVNVEFWYPKDADAKYPLVVFDHGIMGVKTSNRSTFIELASNGYVVCSIDHPYRSLFTVDDRGHLTTINQPYLQEYMDVSQGKYDELTALRLQQKWMSYRIADIKFVLDTILAKTKEAGSGAVYQMIDPGKIGLIGHSLGGESSAQVARERSDVGAVVNLDADLAGEYLDYVDGKPVFNAEPYPVPILTIVTDTLARLMDAVPDANNVIALNHVNATAPKAFEVHLAGTNHMSVTDVPLSMPVLVSIINAAVPSAGGQEVDPLATIEKMNALVLQFFNVYLKGEGTFTYK